jgi:AcrR family transcriptional regulator
MSADRPHLPLRERKKLETWRRIRREALTLFERRGFDAVSIDDIAGSADVSRTTFFNYFKSKEGVVFDPDPDDEPRWRSLIASVPDSQATWDALRFLFVAWADLVGDRLPLQKQLKARSPTLSQSARDSSDRFIEDVRQWLASRESDPTRAALLINAAMAAAGTAFAAWAPGEPLAKYLELVERNFASLGSGLDPT